MDSLVLTPPGERVGVQKEGAVNPHNLHAIYLMQSILTTKAGPVHLVLLTYIRYNENLTD